MSFKYKELREEVLKSGFSLEWRVAKVFKRLDYNYIVRQNHLLSADDSIEKNYTSLVEIDVLAHCCKWELDISYLIECKGARKESALILFESPEEYNKSFPTVYFSKHNNVRLDCKENILASCDFGPRACYTGDFFQVGKKNNKNSNLFKAMFQLTESIDLYFKNWVLAEKYPQGAGRETQIIPVIITNADIYVTTFYENYSRKLINVDEPQIYSVPWALITNTIAYSGQSTLSSVKWSATAVNWYKAAQERRFPYFWVVDISGCLFLG